VLLLALVIAGGAVAAVLLTRPAQAVVPTVVNLPITTAQTDIQNAGFTPNLIYRTDVHTSGIVIGQSPLAGSKVDKGSIVTLTVSSGPGTVAVPNVEGFPKRQATQMIRQAHLTPAQTLTEFSSTIAVGSAIRTDPGAGTQEPPNTAITLFVSSGPAPVVVPNVVGQKRDTATSTLEARGFNVTTTTQASTTQPAGTVTSQSPTGGSKVSPGSTVNLVVATAPPTVAVPDVVGSTFASASSTLKAAGFKVVESFKDTTDTAQNGIVLSQTPAASKQVNNGTTVTVVVGRLKTTTTPTTPTTPTTTT
jgi:serine/threonine-protein kinase